MQPPGVGSTLDSGSKTKHLPSQRQAAVLKPGTLVSCCGQDMLQPHRGEIKVSVCAAFHQFMQH